MDTNQHFENSERFSFEMLTPERYKEIVTLSSNVDDEALSKFTDDSIRFCSVEEVSAWAMDYEKNRYIVLLIDKNIDSIAGMVWLRELSFEEERQIYRNTSKPLNYPRMFTCAFRVYPDFRGNGLFRKLFENIEQHLDEISFGVYPWALTLNVHVENTLAHRAYSKAGFDEVFRFSDENEDEKIFMIRDIKPKTIFFF